MAVRTRGKQMERDGIIEGVGFEVGAEYRR